MLKQTKLTLLSMIQEVDTIEFAWSRIKDWSQVHAGAMTDPNFTERLAQSLECGMIIMSALQEDLSEYLRNTETLSTRQRSRAIWNERALRDHQNRIRGQVLAMNLLIQAIDLLTLDRSQLLQVSDTHFQKSDASAYSIVPSGMSSRLSISTGARRSSLSAESVDLVYQRLSF